MFCSLNNERNASLSAAPKSNSVSSTSNNNVLYFFKITLLFLFNYKWMNSFKRARILLRIRALS